MMRSDQLFDVGGVLLERPFAIRRMNHFGFNTNDPDGLLPFYRDTLGFAVSDTFSAGPDTTVHFLRHNTDHHTLVLIPAHLVHADPAQMSVNQLTWQVGTLEEVVHAESYVRSLGLEVLRAGREMPGSHWHVYFLDPDGYTLELEYGIEQIGWNGRSKPAAMDLTWHEPPVLPVSSDAAEVTSALHAGIDLASGFSGHADTTEDGEIYDVGGVRMRQPFKIVQIGPASIFVSDTVASEQFYAKTMGFETVEETAIDGRRIVFMRCGNEHHNLVLVDADLRDSLGVPSKSLLALGFRLATYRQLRDAAEFLVARGAKRIDLPPELHLGIDYAAHFLDPDGNLLQFYYSMEQVGWSGKPRPASERAIGQPWPETLGGAWRFYDGESFPGPLS